MKRAVAMCAGIMLAAGLGGCATTSAKGPEIREEWVARVPPEQMGPINQARDARRAASDQVVRARVAVTDAQNELAVKKREVDVAESGIDKAEAALKAAKHTGNPGELDRARAELDQANAARDVAEAARTLQQKKVDAANARLKLAEAQLDTTDLAVSRAQYQSLAQIHDTRVINIQPADFDEAMKDREKQQDKLEEKVSKADGEVQKAQKKLDRAQAHAQQAGNRKQG